MKITDSFIKFLQEQGFGVLGQNIFIYRVPNSLKTPTDLFWIIPSGGYIVQKNRTGESTRAYQFLVYYRSVSSRKVDTVLSTMADVLSCSNCVELEGFNLIDMSVTQFPTEQDLDAENRMVGMIQVQLQVHKSCDNS